MIKKIVIVDTESGFIEKVNYALKVQQIDQDYELVQLAPITIGPTDSIVNDSLSRVSLLIQDGIFAVFVDLSFSEEATDNLGIVVASAIKAKFPHLPVFSITNKTKNDRDYDNLSEASLENLDGYFVKSYLFGRDFSKSRFENIFRKAFEKINLKSQSVISSPAKEHFDFAIITALIDPELKEVRKILDHPAEIINAEEFDITDTSTYYRSSITTKKGTRLKVVIASDDRMGMSAATSLASRIIKNFSPKYVVMLGIAAGIDETHNIGDVLIPTHTFDYGSGKLELKLKLGEENEMYIDSFKPYTDPFTMSEAIVSKLKVYKESDFLDNIRKEFTPKQTKVISVHIGPFASGAAVVANEKIPSDLKQREGKIVGFDMEAFGVCTACRYFSNVTPIIIKSISDYGNSAKANPLKEVHQIYAAYTSARFFKEFVCREF